MHEIKKILEALRRLNDLESRTPPKWVRQLSPHERTLAIDTLRETLPTSLLGHHDRLLAQGKRSLSRAHNGVCGSCFLTLTSDHYRQQDLASDLDVCDHCGTFLEKTGEIPGSTKPSLPAQKATKRFPTRI